MAIIFFGEDDIDDDDFDFLIPPKYKKIYKYGNEDPYDDWDGVYEDEQDEYERDI